jgi:hypothetical protein
MILTEPTSTSIRSGARVAPRELDFLRPAVGTTVLIAPSDVLPVAGYLLRHGPAVAIAPEPYEPVVVSPYAGAALPWLSADLLELRQAALERDTDATAAAGFELIAAESLPPADLRSRLSDLAGEDLACVVVDSRSARTVRGLGRASGAPVLALPWDAAPAGGPAVLDAELAARAIPAAARCLATDNVITVSRRDVVPTGASKRRAAHPIFLSESQDLVRRNRADASDRAARVVERAKWEATRNGLHASSTIASEPDALLAVAREHEGIVVMADTAGRWAPAVLRAALRERRPVLLLPADPQLAWAEAS